MVGRGTPRGAGASDRVSSTVRGRPLPGPTTARAAFGGAHGRIAAMATPQGPQPLPGITGMPPVIQVFLGYAFLILGVIGLSLRFVVDQAVAAPVSPVGLVVMALLAYDIFTITLVLQRKEAGRNLALGLSSLTVPGVPLALLSGMLPVGLLVGALGILLLRGLTGGQARAWLNEA
jgi:hypothetical protein